MCRTTSQKIDLRPMFQRRLKKAVARIKPIGKASADVRHFKSVPLALRASGL